MTNNIFEEPVKDTYDDDSKFDESWPSTDRNICDFKETSSNEDTSITSIGDLTLNDPKENIGTLAKLVQRFREQPPQPKTQRLQKEQNFWWMKPKLDKKRPSFTTASTGLSSRYSDESTNAESLPSKNTSPPTLDAFSDIEQMQNKARQLLELSEIKMSHLSTSTPESCKQKVRLPMKSAVTKEKTVQTLEEKKDTCERETETSIARETRETDTSVVRETSDKSRMSFVSNYKTSDLRQEDDILFQWRLARKMEIAAKSVARKENVFMKRRDLIASNSLDCNEVRWSDGSHCRCPKLHTACEERTPCCPLPCCRSNHECVVKDCLLPCCRSNHECAVKDCPLPCSRSNHKCAVKEHSTQTDSGVSVDINQSSLLHANVDSNLLIAPTINEVLSARMFGDNVIENSTPRHAKSSILNTSSDEEFPADELLNDLRRRRTVIREKLRLCKTWERVQR